MVKLSVGLGYIPSVQFAQFYLADQAGYYRDEGLEVTFENKLDPDLMTLVGQGAIDVGIADGTSVIPAVSQEIPVRYVFTVYADFPSIVFAKASSGITGPADLKGRKIGIPGMFGSSWIQLQALLAGVGLTTDDVVIKPFPNYGQLAALEQGVVDAATGFVNNEPVEMELAGTPTVVLALPDDAQLPGNGLIVGQAALDGPKADAIRGFIAATRKAMEEIALDPEKGLDAAIVRVPELATDRATQLAVLEATIDDLAERLHGGERDGRRRRGSVGPVDRVHERAAGLPGGEARHGGRLRRRDLRDTRRPRRRCAAAAVAPWAGRAAAARLAGPDADGRPAQGHVDEDQLPGGVASREGHGLVRDHRGVAGGERPPVERRSPVDQVDVGGPGGRKRVRRRQRRARGGRRGPTRPGGPSRRRRPRARSRAGGGSSARRPSAGAARRTARGRHVGEDPELEEPQRLGRAPVLLGVPQPLAQGGALDRSGEEDPAVAGRVLVAKGALDDVGDPSMSRCGWSGQTARGSAGRR